MTEQEIIQNAEEYACPENSNLFNIEKERVMTHFIAGAQWADKTMLQEVLEWLDENFYNKIDMHPDYYNSEYNFDIIGLNSDFISKEQMLQSFKEQFNIE